MPFPEQFEPDPSDSPDERDRGHERRRCKHSQWGHDRDEHGIEHYREYTDEQKTTHATRTAFERPSAVDGFPSVLGCWSMVFRAFLWVGHIYHPTVASVPRPINGSAVETALVSSMSSRRVTETRFEKRNHATTSSRTDGGDAATSGVTSVSPSAESREKPVRRNRWVERKTVQVISRSGSKRGTFAMSLS